MSKLKAIHEVYADWCPHCVPMTNELMKEMAKELGVPLELHDIETPDVKVADELVLKYGDWSPDYIIPQVFLEFEDGEFKHIFTGYSEGLPYTKRALETLRNSDFYSQLRKNRPTIVSD